MKRFSKYKLIAVMIGLLGALGSCTDDLNRFPTNGETNELLYSTVAGYTQSMATVYSSLAYDYFLREYWNLQEVPTDEAVISWDDPSGTSALNLFNWSADNVTIGNVYNRIMYNVTLCNNFLIESTPDMVSSRGHSADAAATIALYRAEVRFLRAYYYWMMLDLYGNPPFATEQTLLKGDVPKQIKQADLFAFIESELLDVQGDLKAPKANEYGRADQGAAWSLLARLYLNAQTYSGAERYTDALTYSRKVIDAAYSLEDNYQWLLLGDNNLCTNEFILTANYNNEKFITWGGTNYIALGAAGVPAELNGMSGSWGSLRLTQNIPNLFPTADTTVDHRAQFWTTNQKLEVVNLSSTNDGYSSYKFRNLNRDGSPIEQGNQYNNISDIDFPMFRLAEMYLVYAEAALRGATGGSRADALAYVNKLRGRAYANNPSSTDGNITDAELTLDFVLDERARELYWEGHRRTDLIRYGKYVSGDYLWPWKGGVLEGTAVHNRYKLFPLPTADVLANSKNLTQNPGY